MHTWQACRTLVLYLQARQQANLQRSTQCALLLLACKRTEHGSEADIAPDVLSTGSRAAARPTVVMQLKPKARELSGDSPPPIGYDRDSAAVTWCR